MVRAPMALAAAVIGALVMGASSPGRAQKPRFWAGTLTIIVDTAFNSRTSSQGREKWIYAKTNCKVQYVQTLKDGGTATLWFKYSFKDTDISPGALGPIEVTNTVEVPDGVSHSIFDPAFSVSIGPPKAGQLAQYVISHNIYTAQFHGTKTQKVNNLEIPPGDMVVSSNCRDRERVKFSEEDVGHGYVGFPFESNGQVVLRGAYGTFPAEQGTQTVTWKLCTPGYCLNGP